MARPYPLSDQLEVLNCFLSPPEMHNRIMVDLDSSVLFTVMSGHTPPSSHLLSHHLLNRYGGSSDDWSPVPVKNGFLLKLPDWVTQDELEGDSPFWEDLLALIILPWQTQNRSDPLPPSSQLLILVHDFPIAYWHPIYFRQAVSGMGNLLGVSNDALRGTDKSKLCLRIECYDLGLIPTVLRVGHGNRWSDCLIERIGEDGSVVNSSPPNHGSDDIPLLPPVDRIQHHTVRPYIPPGRRRELLSRISEQAPSFRGAPAAQNAIIRHGSTNRAFTPGLGGLIHKNQPVKRQTHQVFLKSQTYPVMCSDKRAPHSPKCVIETKVTCPPSPGIGRFYTHPHASHAYLNKREVDTCLKISTDLSPLEIQTKREGNLTPSLNPYHYKNPLHLPISSLPQSFSSPSPKLPQNPKALHSSPMAEMTPDDEALIQRFIGLDTSDRPDLVVTVPANAATSTDWSRALLVKVISDMTALDNQFSEAMSKAWNAHHDTIFRSVSRNCFLVEFFSQRDMDTVLLSGPWTFRGDLVAARQVASHLDLRAEHIEFGNVWVQLFNVPVNSLNEEGVQTLTRKIGSPISPSVQGLVNGRRFIKQRVLVNLEKPLKDFLSMDHPVMGRVKVHCYYEKVARICTYCGRLGHELSTCCDRARVSMLVQNPNQQGKYDVERLLSPKFGSWMTNAGSIPRPDSSNGSSGTKRDHRGLGQGLDGSHDSFFGGQMVSKLPITPASSSFLSQEGGHGKRPRPAGQDSPAQEL